MFSIDDVDDDPTDSISREVDKLPVFDFSDMCATNDLIVSSEDLGLYNVSPLRLAPTDGAHGTYADNSVIAPRMLMLPPSVVETNPALYSPVSSPTNLSVLDHRPERGLNGLFPHAGIFSAEGGVKSWASNKRKTH
jgi:hypothetical protein